MKPRDCDDYDVACRQSADYAHKFFQHTEQLAATIDSVSDDEEYHLYLVLQANAKAWAERADELRQRRE